MISIPVEDLVFVICAFLGGALLLITIIFDDILGGVLDALNISVEFGGTSLAPLLIAFVAMFGVGGLFSTQLLDIHGGQAAVGGVVSGMLGVGIVFALFSTFRRAEGDSPFTLSDLIGKQAAVAVSIPAGKLGSVYVSAEGQTHEMSASAPMDIQTGAIVTITGVVGNRLLVTPAAELSAEPTMQRGSERA